MRKRKAKKTIFVKRTAKPKGWIKVNLNAHHLIPKGYSLYSNGKSRFSGERKICIVKNKKRR